MIARQVGLGFALLTLLVAVVMTTQYDVDGGMQFTEQHEWITSFGAHYALGVDGLGLLMVLLTVVLVPIVMVASWHETDPEGRRLLRVDAACSRRSRSRCSRRPTCSSSTSCSRRR